MAQKRQGSIEETQERIFRGRVLFAGVNDKKLISESDLNEGTYTA